MTPGATVDFYNFMLPLTVKAKWGVKKQKQGEDDITLQQPFLQADVKLNSWLAFSIISEFEFNDDVSDTWLGAELKTNISEHSELKLFAGEKVEKSVEMACVNIRLLRRRSHRAFNKLLINNKKRGFIKKQHS